MRMRWLGALSLVRVTETMRTPLARRLRVKISPRYSLSPICLKVPMVAMSFLLAARARDHRGLDGDQEASGDRRRTRRAGAQRRMAARDFLASRGMGEPGGSPAPSFLRGERAQGKKVAPSPLRQGDRGASRPVARSRHR